MANLQNGKRRLAACGRSQDEPPAKRAKPTYRPYSASSSTPAFWDGLSRIWLTPRALRELDRRRNNQPPTKPTAPVGAVPGDLARFSRHGGPDLRHLRRYPEPNSVLDAMGASTPSSFSSRRQRAQTAKSTSGLSKSRRSSAYTKNFQQHLIDYGVYMNSRKSTPGNSLEIHTELARQRASLSPSRFSDGAFESFKRNNEDATFESEAVAAVIPIICGSADIASKQDVLFTELEPLTTVDAVKPKPDFFDGAHLRHINQDVRQDEALRSTVIPTKYPNVPVAPNFFLEVKGPNGTAPVVQRQACYAGAYGARAMHTLQNYGQVEPTYDGNAYTYSSTYHNGMLELHAHHVTPTTTGGRPEYHMTKIRRFDIIDSRESFVRGVAAFRNGRDLAKRHRDRFIEAANAASGAKTPMSTACDSGDSTKHTYLLPR